MADDISGIVADVNLAIENPTVLNVRDYLRLHVDAFTRLNHVSLKAEAKKVLRGVLKLRDQSISTHKVEGRPLPRARRDQPSLLLSPIGQNAIQKSLSSPARDHDKGPPSHTVYTPAAIHESQPLQPIVSPSQALPHTSTSLGAEVTDTPRGVIPKRRQACDEVDGRSSKRLTTSHGIVRRAQFSLTSAPNSEDAVGMRADEFCAIITTYLVSEVEILPFATGGGQPS